MFKIFATTLRHLATHARKLRITGDCFETTLRATRDVCRQLSQNSGSPVRQGLKNAQDASRIRYGASTIQAGSARVASRPPMNVHDLVIVMRQSWGGGGGTLIFSSYVGSGPASTVHQKKYQEFQAPPKKFEILATKKIFPILYLDFIKDPKMHRNVP